MKITLGLQVEKWKLLWVDRLINGKLHWVYRLINGNYIRFID